MTQSIIITSAFAGISSVKMAWSTDPTMTTGVSQTSAVTVSANQLTKHTLTGLANGTRYYYQPASSAGTLFGDIGTFKTKPAAGATATMSIILTSCQGSFGGPDHKYDVSQPAWRKMQDLGPHDLVVQQGDFGYWGSTLHVGGSTGGQILKYGKQLIGFDRMRDVLLKAPSIIERSDHEYSPDNGDSNATGPYGPIVAKMIATAQEMMPVDPAVWGDTRDPKQGLWYSWKATDNILFVVTDFRNLERTLQATDDGPDKTALGATQLDWFFNELRRDDAVLKVVLNDNAWGPAGSADVLGSAAHQDKWWAYQYEQAVIAEFVSNNATTAGQPIWVDYWGGDRHVVGFLSADNNVLADGTPCPWDVLTASGSDKNGLSAAVGELYDEVYGFTILPGDVTEVRQFGHITLTDDPSTKTITRVFDGWNCATDPYVLYTPQTYAPVKVIDGKTKVWSYDTGGGDSLTAVNPGDQTDTVGDTVSLQLAATGGTPPYSFAAIRLPSGTSISAGGLITGTLTTVQVKNPLATVTDDDGTQASTAWTWTVDAAPPPALTVNNPGDQANTVGDAVSLTVTASGGVPPYAWSLSGQPPGASINASTGKITGTLTTAGDYTVTVTATDSVSTVAHAIFAWHVAEGSGFTWPAGSIRPDTTDGEDLREHIGADTHANFPPGSGGGYQA